MKTNEYLELYSIAALVDDHVLGRGKQSGAILRASDVSDKLDGVMSGQVQLRWGGNRVETIAAGSCIEVGALVDPDHRHFGTSVALCDRELLVMNRDEFLLSIQELCIFGLEMLHVLEQPLQTLKEHMGEC